MNTDNTQLVKTRCNTVSSSCFPQTRQCRARLYILNSITNSNVAIRPFIDLTRKVIIAAKEAKVGYFVMARGCGSLHLPRNHLQTCSESKYFWLWYRRGIADSHTHVSYMEERLGSMGTALRKYREARVEQREGRGDESSKRLIDEYEESVMNNDKALEFVTAGRTSYMFFDGNTSFKWTYVSPPALYRSGKRTGAYSNVIDEIPVKPAPEGTKASVSEDRLHGISAADLAIAIADDVESQNLAWKHWSALGDMSDDITTSAYITI